MEYGKLKPLEGVNGYEPTAFTKKTIKELIEEEMRALAEAEAAVPEVAEAAPAAAPQPKRPLSATIETAQEPRALDGSWLNQKRPTRLDELAAAEAGVTEDAPDRADEPVEKRGLLRRLMRR